MKLTHRTKKVFLRLHYKTLEGNRVVLSEKDAGPRILKILARAGANPLSTRQIGERLLPDAYHLSTSLEFVFRTLTRLQEAGQVEGSKLPQNSGAGSRYIWVWKITKREKKKAWGLGDVCRRKCPAETRVH